MKADPTRLRRPSAVANASTRPFWTAAAAGELRLPRCVACDRLHYPPPPRCPTCLDADLRWEFVPPAATVHAWTTAHLATVPGVEPPFTIVEGALCAQPGLVVVALADSALVPSLALDRPVELAFEPDQDGTAYAVFRSRSEPASPSDRGA